MWLKKRLTAYDLTIEITVKYSVITKFVLSARWMSYSLKMSNCERRLTTRPMAIETSVSIMDMRLDCMVGLIHGPSEAR